ncbi:uncharacterized protein MELLADRAFT_84233 [Melampsora larici-populina 98AG31]|uniref:Uncharacterized protein n=1 Tax=Melampsora larici-populina (strain 98AG31 / pathotype 3-4-7) TaxID=747676 RepID=F4SC21_MELLP|nr:uncharacterized protein MELLADRAFT_84233 [Melampsora larici-populina 98AG31]EGF97803.1 hypothetical protein MELLADRAFT_84233 [Melampsora larici-populina 98AG31]
MILADRKSPSHPLNIKWLGSIAKVPEYLKSLDKPLNTETTFQDWARKAHQFSGKRALLNIKMEKPVSEAAQMASLTFVVMKSEVFERASRKIRTSDGQPVERVHGDQDDVHAHDALVSKLLKQGKLDPRINRQIHIYWIPKDNFKHYVLLTRGHAIKWAKAIRDPDIHGICPLNPPRELWTAVTADPPPSRTPKHRHGYVDGLSEIRNKQLRPAPACSLLDRPTAKMEEYIDFLKIDDPEVLKVLTREKITDYHQFSSGSITKDDLKSLDPCFRLGVISKLLDNVKHFDMVLKSRTE